MLKQADGTVFRQEYNNGAVVSSKRCVPSGCVNMDMVHYDQRATYSTFLHWWSCWCCSSTMWFIGKDTQCQLCYEDFSSDLYSQNENTKRVLPVTELSWAIKPITAYFQERLVAWNVEKPAHDWIAKQVSFCCEWFVVGNICFSLGTTQCTPTVSLEMRTIWKFLWERCYTSNEDACYTMKWGAVAESIWSQLYL